MVAISRSIVNVGMTRNVLVRKLKTASTAPPRKPPMTPRASPIRVAIRLLQ